LTFLGESVVAVAVVAVAATQLSTRGIAVIAVTVGLTLGLEQLRRSLLRVVERLSQPPLMASGLDLGAARPTPPPGRIASTTTAPVALVLALVAGIVGGRGTVAVLCVLAVLVAVIPCVALAVPAVKDVRRDRRSASGEAVRRAVEQLRPEVVVSFDGTVGELYQLRMWLRPVAALGRPAIVLLRSPEVMAALGPSPIPIVCTPYNGTVSSLPVPDRVVALFPTHRGDVLSVLRRPEVRSVFVGHGESDKPDSVNRFARAYDEVWVAGPLARRRYVQAGIGVHDEQVVEIGLPTSVGADSPQGSRPVVLYAPTWEGWGDDPHHSSLPHVGVAVVQALLAQPGIAVRYRPHPLTGVRDPRVRDADREVRRLVGAAAVDGADVAWPSSDATALITDISSLIGDWLPLDRPYAVLDTRGLGAEELARRAPTTSAAVIISPDLTSLETLLEAARGGADPTRADRQTLLADVLGDPATSQQRFAAAVTRLLG
jgi:hypothetical protein